MELQIQDLVSSIKKDGIESANKEAAIIIAEAKKQADSILADAKAEAARTMESAKKELDIFKSNVQVSADQAKRDAELAFKSEIQVEFEKILKHDIDQALNEQALTTLIIAAINGENVSAYSVEVNEVTAALKQGLAEQIKNGLEIRPSKKVHAGFRLAAKNGSGYFDCTDEEISKMLMPFFRNISL